MLVYIKKIDLNVNIQSYSRSLGDTLFQTRGDVTANAHLPNSGIVLGMHNSDETDARLNTCFGVVSMLNGVRTILAPLHFMATDN
jgi:hypothetical protein